MLHIEYYIIFKIQLNKKIHPKDWPINIQRYQSVSTTAFLTMENLYISLPHFLLILLVMTNLPVQISSADDNQVYIVYFGEHSGEETLQQIEESHLAHLSSVKDNEEDTRLSLVYSYKHSINGFAAVLTPQEASRLSEKEGVVSVIRSHPGKHVAHTTRSWEFAGLRPGDRTWRKEDDLGMKSRYGKDVIVGMLDNGVWPESRSFSDEGMGPIPQSWKGTCQSGDAFNSSHCNKKLIGARFYIKAYEAHYGPVNRTLDYRSPRDRDGHGTHTASTVAGRSVDRVSALGGFAFGTASGGAPLARLAIYKVCWAIPGQGKDEGNTCFEADMLAAIDDAIADGVDVLSISIGTKDPTPLTQDGIAIGALHAAKHEIVVACSAGNAGPAAATLSNPAPWIITVGASSVDRAFLSPVVLGNTVKITGQTVTPYTLSKHKMYPLVYAADIINPDVSQNLSGQCLPGSLSPEKAKGKIVMCLRGNGTRVGKGMEVKRAGGIGFILGNSKPNGDELVADAHVLPATAVNYQNALKILDYINSTRSPTAYIVPARTVLDAKPAPFMAAFSSRGPSTITPDILKPDITAPGLNILAAWSEASSPTKLENDNRVVKYNILSGTSMSCPHIGGAAALLKAIHPDWSSAAIRSALMTSAGLANNQGNHITDASGNSADPFQFGSGHFRPTKAVDPGLVYDASYSDYLLYLCSIGIGIANTLDSSFRCPKIPPPPSALNYPSLVIPRLNGTVTAVRTVTNVGGGMSVYFASVNSPPGISVTISPAMLYFKRTTQKRSFTVSVQATASAVDEKGKYVFGSYTWTDGIHDVRSPIAVSVGQ